MLLCSGRILQAHNLRRPKLRAQCGTCQQPNMLLYDSDEGNERHTGGMGNPGGNNKDTTKQLIFILVLLRHVAHGAELSERGAVRLGGDVQGAQQPLSSNRVFGTMVCQAVEHK